MERGDDPNGGISAVSKNTYNRSIVHQLSVICDIVIKSSGGRDPFHPPAFHDCCHRFFTPESELRKIKEVTEGAEVSARAEKKWSVIGCPVLAIAQRHKEVNA